MGWCPAALVSLHGEKVPLYPWLATLLVMMLQKKYLCRDYSKHFEFVPCLHGKLIFQLTSCTKGCRGRSSKKCLEFFFYRISGKYKKKEGINKNCTTAFSTLNVGFICEYKKLFWRLSFNLRLSFHVLYRT